VAKHKLQRFAEIETFDNVIQPRMSFPITDHALKGKWGQDFFRNDKPIVLELGCGRGEYTVNLAEKYPDKNFVGVDIKGARLWRGAKTAMDNKMTNVGFLRLQIDKIDYFFGPDEVSEIWITFPDPQPQVSRIRKRLTSPNLLEHYKKMLIPNGIIHLKTDNAALFAYTEFVMKQLHCQVHQCTHDLYQSAFLNDVLSIKTTYEQMYLKIGVPINYLNFSLPEGI
jgi:tRNA (guanine-N7-)-methyltransferase